VSGDADQKVRAEIPSHNLGAKRARGQMNSSGAGGKRDIRAIVDQEARRSALRQGRGPQRDFIQHTRSQSFFSKLDQGNAGSNRSRDEFEELREVVS
jgi:hypothetical protein